MVQVMLAVTSAMLAATSAWRVAASSASSDSPLLIVGMFMWAGFSMAAFLYYLSAAQRYGERYLVVHGRTALGEYELPDFGNPRWQLVVIAASWRRWKTLWVPQSDPDLESARRLALGRLHLAIAVAVLGLAIPISLSLIRV